MLTVVLCGGSHHGRVVRILHGSSVTMVASGETYERLNPPNVLDGFEVWRLVQITEKAKQPYRNAVRRKQPKRRGT